MTGPSGRDPVEEGLGEEFAPRRPDVPAGPGAEPDQEGFEERIEERLAELRTDAPLERQLLTRAIGGWRGLIDSGIPSGVFVIAYLVDGNRLAPAVWAAVAAGAVVAVIRLVRREDLTQIAGGFAGLLVSAFVASRTGHSQDFFLPGLLINAAYFLGSVLSILVGWPALGLMLGAMSGSLTGWRAQPPLRRAYATATWIWAGVFGSRLLVQVPLYFAGATAALGVTKIVMGWPLFLLGAWLTFLVVRPVMRHQQSAAAADSDDQTDNSPSSASS